MAKLIKISAVKWKYVFDGANEDRVIDGSIAVYINPDKIVEVNSAYRGTWLITLEGEDRSYYVTDEEWARIEPTLTGEPIVAKPVLPVAPLALDHIQTHEWHVEFRRRLVQWFIAEHELRGGNPTREKEIEAQRKYQDLVDHSVFAESLPQPVIDAMRSLRGLTADSWTALDHLKVLYSAVIPFMPQIA